jgi:hypothetical protein
MPVDDKTLYTRAEVLAFGERVLEAFWDAPLNEPFNIAALLDGEDGEG